MIQAPLQKPPPTCLPYWGSLGLPVTGCGAPAVYTSGETWSVNGWSFLYKQDRFHWVGSGPQLWGSSRVSFHLPTALCLCYLGQGAPGIKAEVLPRHRRVPSASLDKGAPQLTRRAFRFSLEPQIAIAVAQQRR